MPPPDPPGIGIAPVVVAPLQNVFSTIATSVGPAGVKVTVAGSGAHVIVGEDVVQPKVTVPLKPGVDVSTIPIANVPPGGTGGKAPPAGGVTEIEIGELETVSRVEPVTSFNVAEIVVVKPAVPPTVARPAALIVAASVLDDAQVTVAVMSFVLLSEKVPVAVNCTDELIGSVGFAGVTAIDFNVAAAAVNVAVTVSAEAGIVNVQVAAGNRARSRRAIPSRECRTVRHRLRQHHLSACRHTRHACVRGAAHAVDSIARHSPCSCSGCYTVNAPACRR